MSIDAHGQRQLDARAFDPVRVALTERGRADVANSGSRADAPAVVVVGAPGAGKGTQCRLLVQAMGLAHLSIGDILRQEISRESQLGALVRRSVESGDLVPDALIVDVAIGFLDRCVDLRGVLFDGFPRTVRQAEAFEAARPDVVRLCVAMVVPRPRLVERLLARARDDDRPAVIDKRLRSYERDTKPLIGWYGRQGIVRYVDGNASPTRVAQSLTRCLREAGLPTDSEREDDRLPTRPRD